MSVKVFKTNKAGKIEFTRCELEKLLNETYREGYTDGENHAKSNYWTWTSPNISVTNTPYYGTVTCDTGSLLRANTVDGIASTATLCDSTSITGVCDNTVATSTKAAIAPSNVIKVDVCSSADEAPETEKVESKEIPAKTCESNGMVFNMDEVAKTIDAILSGKYDLASIFANPIGNTNVNGAKKAIEDTPFTNLAKELRSL